MKQNPCRLLVGTSFALIFSAIAPAQENLVLPDDPLAAIAKMPVQKPATEGKRVLVVDGDGKPLAGISVVAIAVMDHLDRGKMVSLQVQAMEKYGKSLTKSQHAFFAVLGQRFVTDERGVVLVPKMDKSGVVLAVRGRNSVRITGRQEKDGVIKLVLRRDLPIHVLVVGPKGKPARGVPVAITTSLNYRFSPESSVQTDKAGRAQLRWGFYRSHPRNKLYVRAIAATKKHVELEIDPRKSKNDAKNPIKLTMPEFGSVRVYVLGKDKKRLPIDGATLTILNPQARYNQSQFQAGSVKGDSATFAIVEVGAPIEISCTYQGSQRPEKIKSDGPRHHMDMRVLTIKGVSAPIRVKLRLLGLDGKPVLSEQVGIIFMQNKRLQGSVAKTDAEGRLDVVVPSEFEALEDGRLVVARRFSRSHRRFEYLGSKALSFGQIKPKRDGLGDVQLEREELVAAGKVVDEAGKPIPNATITVRNIYGQYNSRGYSGRREFFDCQSKTDKNGRFELRALDGDLGSVKLSIWANNYVTQSGDEVKAGTKDHKVVMARAGIIEGRLLGMKGMRYSPSTRLLDKDGVDQRKHASNTDQTGNFKFRNCLPGEYTVEFKVAYAKEPFLTIRGVKLEEGKPCRDPRMMNIDLSKFMRVVKVTVVGPDEKPVRATVTQTVREGGRYRWWKRITLNDGVCILALPRAGGDVSVHGQDAALRTKRLPMLKEDIVVQLEPAVLVKLSVPGLPKLPQNLRLNLRVHAKVRAPGNWRTFSSRDRPTLDDGKAECYVDKPGDFRLTMSATLVSDGGRRQTSMRGGRLTLEFTVKKLEQGKKTPTIELKLDEDQLATIKDLVEEAKEAKKDGEDR